MHSWMIGPSQEWGGLGPSSAGLGVEVQKLAPAPRVVEEHPAHRTARSLEAGGSPSASA
jgi:hypothetical protein